MSETFDAIVFGQGLTGFSVASTLVKKEKKVAVLYQATGATSVSSGAWDFGVISSPESSFDQATSSESWKKYYNNILCEGKNLLNSQLIKENISQIAADLSTLPMTLSFDAALRLPTTAGLWKNTFAAQAPQAKANAKNLTGKKVGLLGSPSWRFNAKAISSRLSHNSPGLQVLPAEIDLSFAGNDCALPHFASRLRDPNFFQQFVMAAKSLRETYDFLLLPPIFPTCGLFDEFEKAIGIASAECLAVNEPTPGYRLMQAITIAFNSLGVTTSRIREIEPFTLENKVLGIKVFDVQSRSWRDLKATNYILATGKLFGGGIDLGYRHVRESIFDFPVFRERNDKPIRYRNELNWMDRNFYETQPWAELGLKVGADWKVLDESNTPIFDNVRACGSVLGGVDFSKSRLGLGFMIHSGRECARGL